MIQSCIVIDCDDSIEIEQNKCEYYDPDTKRRHHEIELWCNWWGNVETSGKKPLVLEERRLKKKKKKWFAHKIHLL